MKFPSFTTANLIKAVCAEICTISKISTYQKNQYCEFYLEVRDEDFYAMDILRIRYLEFQIYTTDLTPPRGPFLMLAHLEIAFSD